MSTSTHTGSSGRRDSYERWGAETPQKTYENGKEMTYLSSYEWSPSVRKLVVRRSPRLAHMSQRKRRYRDDEDLDDTLERRFEERMRNNDPTQDFEYSSGHKWYVEVDNDGTIMVGQYPMTQDSQIEEIPGTEDQSNGFGYLLEAVNMN